MPPIRPAKPPGTKSVRKRGTNHTKTCSPSLQEVYIRSCAELGLRPNSAFTSLLPDKGGVEYPEATLDLSRNYVGDKGIAPILATLEKMPNVRALIFSENGLRNRGVELVCASATNLPHLEFIELSDNFISEGAAVALFRLIEHHSQLQMVVLENTKIPVQWRVKLLDALAEKRSTRQSQAHASILVS
ncbi:putative Leucine Rich repeat [Leishmania naiffi]|uniref:Leucine Rich repeat n=1 Tax=Leishmania naiffi TaxID=5678 RepID=A0AAW3C6D7_9TRYP